MRQRRNDGNPNDVALGGFRMSSLDRTMKRGLRLGPVRVCLFLCITATAVSAQLATRAISPPPMATAEFDALFERVSNWGRWGRDDQLGALNLIGPAVRRAASWLVRDGTAISLSRLITSPGGASSSQPELLHMLSTASTPDVTSHSERTTIAPHGPIHTHLDAFSHFFYKDRMYNGIPRSAVTDRGAERLAVTGAGTGIYTRGVLIDLPRLKRVPYLEPGAPILVSELEAWLETAKLELRPGDAVFIRTGRSTMPVTPPPMQIAGLHVSTVRWLKQHDIALLGSDVGADVWPSGVDGVRSPVHTLLLVAMGTPILDNCDLEDLSRAAAERQRWEFLVTLAPLRISGATGSAVNPVAVF